MHRQTYCIHQSSLILLEKIINEWFLMKSPLPLSIIMISYWVFVLKLGPMYMKNKKAFILTKVLAAYNAFQVFLSSVIFIYGSKYVLRFGLFPSVCPQDSPESIMYLTNGIYFFFITKIIELLDTIFFVLRKKVNQVTFLHVYHHSITIIVCWCTLKMEPFVTMGPFIGATNALVHIFMYTYYGLSAFPAFNKYLWWKKYITKLQVIQFIILTIHTGIEYKLSKCKISLLMLGTIIFHMFLFIYLFVDFYVKAYSIKENANKSHLNYCNKNTHENESYDLSHENIKNNCKITKKL